MSTDPAPFLTLDAAPLGAAMRVSALCCPPGREDWARWLAEIGFLPGEPVMLRVAAPGGDPMMIRIGQSSFALRRAEAACVRIEPS